ncbi:hypothetical protein LTR35_000347 [Friedmanniomyces endolithicus]|uniref:Vacuolar protein sorting-associated protein 51 homolog n=1 Tax=Friedmanniomyces endolithicus TaxID=329885 RepID=A0AAN6FUP9_9PEZI|nr:hypothetical protein LTS00_013330 [Friedmanniomyces endolithicus]KAK0293741.1 hypothetical protein LTR35_000347 [Friedmanniomyces endolithicus]KAK0324255.1 hypothetical protein LTR82_004693 [Friedmanniomyces endolithicus]KAK0985899.1 hypothetical protein LTR54_013562 [Friedmanniomyces endolithicus]
MSTIASPRPSISLSSRRTSTSTDAGRSPSTSRAPASAASSLRRNRVALRDYYGIKNAASADAPPTPTLDSILESELDRPDFDASAYVQSLLATEGLEGILRVEAGLVSEIRGLDGEKKALVYDNYSKLIAATDTIKSMREKMDPVTETSTLMADIARIAETASKLSIDMGKQYGGGIGDAGSHRVRENRAQQETVKWVLGAPNRLRELVAESKTEEADAQWNEVSGLLARGGRVEGAEQVRRRCLEALESRQTS